MMHITVLVVITFVTCIKKVNSASEGQDFGSLEEVRVEKVKTMIWDHLLRSEQKGRMTIRGVFMIAYIY